MRRAALLLAWLAAPATAQVNMDAYRDYFLVGQFGEVCTMCEVTVLCREGDTPPAEVLPDTGDFTLYHLQTRSFWSQVSTIYDWFVANFSEQGLAVRGHTRPVHRYQVTAGRWSATEVIEGRLVLDPGVLEFGDRVIDRVDRSWNDTSGERLGYCARLPLWDTLDAIAANAPGAQP